MRKDCSCDREKLLKFEAEDQEFAKFLRSLAQFIQTVKSHRLEQLEFKLEKTIGMQEKLEKPLKFNAEDQEFAKFLRSLLQFIQTVNFKNNFL